MMKLTRTVRKTPNLMSTPLMVTRPKLSKLGEPMSAAISGIMMFSTREFTTAPNAAPIMTATARSTTLPFMMKSLNPFNMHPKYLTPGVHRGFLVIFLLKFLIVRRAGDGQKFLIAVKSSNNHVLRHGHAHEAQVPRL